MEKEDFGAAIVNKYKIIDHDCYSEDLEPLGMVQCTPIKVNKSFYDADFHIVTGLVGKPSAKIEEIVQNAVLYAIHKKGKDTGMAFTKQGFYVVLKKLNS